MATSWKPLMSDSMTLRNSAGDDRVGNRAYPLKPLLDGIFGQHFLHRLVKLVDDRLRRAGRERQTVPAEIANSR